MALQKMGHMVGYLSDGLNDAPSLHMADVGISVKTMMCASRTAGMLALSCASCLYLGRISSILDHLIFPTLLWLLHGDETVSHTVRFMGAVVSDVQVIYAVRIHLAFWRSRPAWTLLAIGRSRGMGCALAALFAAGVTAGLCTAAAIHPGIPLCHRWTLLRNC